MTKIAMLHTGIRGDEKLIIKAAKERNVEMELVDIRKLVFDPQDISFWEQFDAILERSISTVKGNAVIEYLTNLGLPVINKSHVVNICNDKFQTATVLDAASVPNLRSLMAFNEVQAKEAIETLGGYPAVLKSREGSWGRLMAKVNDDEALEGVMGHREFMGPEQSAVVIQEYINKPDGRDIRAFVIEGKAICAIYRASPHWITNTARGGVATNCEVTEEMADLCRRSSDAVGGGILAMDIFETDDGLKINEINHTMEFKNSEKPTGVSISGAIIDYCINLN